MDDLFCYIQTVHFHTLLSYHLYIFVSLKPPLKCLELIKKGLSMMSIIEHFSEFSRDYRAFLWEK